VQLFELRQQFLPAFFPGWIGAWSFNWAGYRAFRFFVGAHAFGASVRVNDTDSLTLSYRPVGALSNTGSTANTLVGVDLIRHRLFLLSISLGCHRGGHFMQAQS
jgi:hypothetical protein